MISFLLDSNKIHKKQKFSAFDIVEPQSKEMRLAWYITCIDLIAQVSLAWWSFLFLDMLTLKLRIILIILPTDLLETILPAACTTKN